MNKKFNTKRFSENFKKAIIVGLWIYVRKQTANIIEFMVNFIFNF